MAGVPWRCAGVATSSVRRGAVAGPWIDGGVLLHGRDGGKERRENERMRCGCRMCGWEEIRGELSRVGPTMDACRKEEAEDADAAIPRLEN